MQCPKCHGEMRTYERNGIQVDQCTECRGIFLDRGELEHLVSAESSFYKPATPERRETFEYRGHHHKKRKKHFLEELFD